MQLPTLDEVRQEMARRHLLAFTTYTFPGYSVNWHHRVVADKLTEFAQGKIKRLILCMPPRRGKSELGSRRLPAYILGINPDARIISTSYGLDLAMDMSRDVQRILDSEEYQGVFPGTRLNSRNVVTNAKAATKRTADQWEIVGHKGGYLARGVGGGLTGKGGNFLIVDDPIKDDEQARSPVYRAFLWRWFSRVLKTRRAPGAGILVIQTRWHEDDLVGKLLEDERTNPRADHWEVVNLREIREEEDAPDDPRAVGEVLWPEAFTLEDALSIQSTDPQGFAALYQQRPAPIDGNLVQIAHCQQRYAMLPDEPGEWIQSWDLKAGSKDPSSSYAVGQVWFRPHASRGRIYLVDQVRGRWDFPETLAQVDALTARYPMAWTKLVEGKADGKAVIAMSQSRIAGLVATSPQGDKVSRLRAVAPFFQAGNVWLPERSRAPWIDEFIQELTTFPAAPNDDQVDAASQALAYFGTAPTPGVY